MVKDYKAMVFSVEYNANFPVEVAITFPNNPKEYWQGDRGYGASLKALNMVAVKNGYSLLWVVPFLDAFFIRNDLIDDNTKKTVILKPCILTKPCQTTPKASQSSPQELQNHPRGIRMIQETPKRCPTVAKRRPRSA